MRIAKGKTTSAVAMAVGFVAAMAVTSVASGNNFRVTGGDHVFDESASIFPGDPAPSITVVANIADDGFLVEQVTTGTHTGTHLDAPGHFIDGGRTVDQLAGKDLVWPLYVIDVRDRMAATADDGFQLSIADIRAYERQNGRIKNGSMVVIRTGFDAFFRTPAFLEAAPGFSGDAVQWLVDQRNVGGIGSDTFGPDATSDADFAATFTILNNNRVALPGLNNLGAMQIKGDIVMAPTVALRDGSGYQTDPLGCLGRVSNGDHDNDD
jgi:kynurenine formamidase